MVTFSAASPTGWQARTGFFIGILMETDNWEDPFEGLKFSQKKGRQYGSMSVRRLLLAFSLAALPLLAACQKSQVEVYEVPKEPDPTLPAADAGAAPPADGGMPAAGGPMSGPMGGSVPTAAGPGLVWTAPADWRPGTASAMRKGSYSVPGPEGTADLSITAFPGDVGGDLANVNRWRGQVGLPPLTEQNLDQNVDRTEINGLHVMIVDLAGGGPNSILGALVPYSDGVWFFKLMGPAALVARTKPAFLAFLQTVKAPSP
jgi:hypothetical protein